MGAEIRETKLVITTDATGVVKGAKLYQDSLKQMESSTRSITSLMKSHWVGMVAGIVGVPMTISAAWDMAEMAAKFQEQHSLLDRLAAGYGTTADTIVAKIQEASRGLISMRIATQDAGSALIKHVSPDKLAGLASAAFTLAKFAQESTQEVFTNLVGAVASGGERSMNRLVGLTDLHTKFTDAQVSNMSKIELASARYEMVMERVRKVQLQMADDGMSAADRMERLKIVIEDLRLTIGGVFLKTGFAAVAMFHDISASVLQADMDITRWLDTLSNLNKPAVARVQIATGEVNYERPRSDAMKNTLKDMQDRIDRQTAMAKEYWNIVSGSSAELGAIGKMGEESGKKVTDAWQKVKDALKLDVTKLGMGELERKLADISHKVLDLTRQWGAKPEISAWKAAMSDYERAIEAGTVLNETSKVFFEVETKRREMLKADAESDITFQQKSMTERLQAEKTLVDLRAQYMELSPLQALTAQSDTEKKLLETEKERLVGLVANRSAYAETYEEQKKATLENKKDWQEVELIEKRLLDLETQRTYRLKEYTATFDEGMAVGFRRYVAEAGSSFQQGVQLAQDAAKAMQQSFSDLFFDAMQGNLKSAMDYWRAFVSSIERMLSDLLAKQLVQKIFMPKDQSNELGKGLGGGDGLKNLVNAAGSWLSNLLSPGGKNPWGVGPGMPGSSLEFHSGGIVGETYVPTRPMPWSTFAHAARLHGGLAPDEFPAILQSGEQVIPRGNTAGKSPIIVNMNISAMDAQSFYGYTLANKKAIADAIVSATRDGHPVGRR
jgi:hypothetical protein